MSVPVLIANPLGQLTNKFTRKRGFSGLCEQIRSIDCAQGVIHNVAILMKSNVFAMLVVSSWLIIGMCVYKHHNEGFRWSDAFYFSVQSGFSIGFGSLAETSAASQIYSCFHVIMGGLLAGTLIGSFFDTILDSHETFKQKLKAHAHREMLEAAANADGVVTTTEWCMLRWHDCKGFSDTETGGFAWLSLLTFGWLTMGTIVARWTYQDIDYPISNNDTAHMTLATSLEFAVTAVTTGGLSGFPKEAGYDNSLKVGTAIFCGFYCLIGVPLYGLWIGKWAVVLGAVDVKKAVEEECRKALDKGVDDDIAKAYMEEYMPIIYPSKEDGGIMSPEVLQKKKEMIEKDNPALVDALFVYLIRTGKLDVDTLEGFRKGWQKTVGARKLEEHEAAQKMEEDVDEEISGNATVPTMGTQAALQV